MDTSHIAERLTSRFGLGTKPTLRAALYQRLAALVATEGEPAYLVIATAAADAAGKREPGRYFAHVVMKRLMERGVIEAPEI